MAIHIYIHTYDAKIAAHGKGMSQSQLRSVRGYNPGSGNGSVSKEDAERRLSQIESEIKRLQDEGASKKDARGAWPKDIIRKIDKLRLERDTLKAVVR